MERFNILVTLKKGSLKIFHPLILEKSFFEAVCSLLGKPEPPNGFNDIFKPIFRQLLCIAPFPGKLPTHTSIPSPSPERVSSR
jgi:hypothetical protein